MAGIPNNGTTDNTVGPNNNPPITPTDPIPPTQPPPTPVADVEDLDVRWTRWRCLVCNYTYEGVNPLKKCPRCNNENPDKFADVD